MTSLDYDAERWYYEMDQLNVTYAARLERYKNDEGGRWMNVFYGGREIRAAQGNAAFGPQRPGCSDVGGLLDSGRAFTGFAVDMARYIVPTAMRQMEGKVLWLLSESHGHALVHRWLECDPEGQRWLSTGKIAVFGAYKNEDRVRIQTRVKNFLEDTFNAADNLRGERCKLIIGGAGDLGVGVTFTEVRHIFMDLNPSFFGLLQQMGRGQRLCKHFRLEPARVATMVTPSGTKLAVKASERTLDFHVPVPVLTTGWRTPELATTQRTYPGGIGSSRVTMNDYVSQLKTGTSRETISAPLHVPIHAFETLVDLQRSRVQFLSGIQTFESVAMDAAYYKKVAGWETPRVDLASEPTVAARIANFVRDRIRETVDNIQAFHQEGLRLLQDESRDNTAYNKQVLARGPLPENARVTRDAAKEEAFRNEVFRTQEVQRKKQVAAEKRTEKEQRKQQKEEDDYEELMASGRCSNYTILENGKLARKDKPPGFYVHQETAIKLIESGSRLGDPNCMALVVAMRRRKGL